MGLIHLGAVVLLRLSWVILRLRVEEDHDYDGEAKIQQKHHRCPHLFGRWNYCSGRYEPLCSSSPHMVLDQFADIFSFYLFGYPIIP